jgi:acyl-CoA thioesterase-1
MKKLLIIAAFTCAAGMAVPAQAQIVALGQSNTRGQGVSPSDSYPSQLEAMLRARGKGYSIVNAGISGDTSAGILARVDSDVPQGTRIVVLEAGFRNDVARGYSREATVANVRAIIARLRARRIQVVNAIPFEVAAIQAGMTQGDGIHLTLEGHRFVATRILPSIH